MHDFKSKMKAVSRRISYLRGKIDSSEEKSNSSSYDKAEVNALSALVRVAALYEEARGSGGAHVENTMCLARDVFDDLLTETSLPPDQRERVQGAWEKLNQSISTIRKIAEADDEKS